MVRTLRELGEKRLLQRLQKYIGEAPQIIRTFSEDCAVVDMPGEHYQVFTVDLLVEDVHFRHEFMPAYYIGRKGLKANLSDVAAVGGEALYFLVSIAAPADTSVKIIDEIYDGMKSVSDEAGALLLGGNISSAPILYLDIFVVGRVVKNKVRMRSDAKVGDAIFVTGRLGAAAEGLKLLNDGFRCIGEKAESVILPSKQRDSSYVREAILAQFDPPSLLRAAHLIGGVNGVHAMIDLSDGLASDLAEICNESAVGAKLELKQVPVHPSVLHWERKRKSDPLLLALYGGEDYHLLFTISQTAKKNIDAIAQQAGVECFEIGTIVDEKEGVFAFDERGKRMALSRGYEHFKS